MSAALVPPLGRRLRFWLFAGRVDPEYRPWVAQQIVDPRYRRRRALGAAGIQLFVVLTQLGLALQHHDRWYFLAPALLLVLMAVSLASARPLKPEQTARLLAYYGVTASGDLREPASWKTLNPLGTDGLVLLMCQVLLFASGGAVVLDHYTAHDRCRSVTPADAAALQALVGKPVPYGYGDVPLVPEGARLKHVRRVDFFGEVRFVAAYVEDPRSGHDLGPAVWQVVDPVYPAFAGQPQVSISASDLLARSITPAVGYSINPSADRLIEKARSCARQVG